MAKLLSVMYETERWIPGYTSDSKTLQDAVVITVERELCVDRAYLFVDRTFEPYTAWLLWGAGNLMGQPQRGAIEWTTNLEVMADTLVRWIEGPG